MSDLTGQAYFVPFRNLRHVNHPQHQNSLGSIRARHEDGRRIVVVGWDPVDWDALEIWLWLEEWGIADLVDEVRAYQPEVEAVAA